MIIIGISGFAKTGKDTAAGYLVRDMGFTRVALADEIKRAAQKWFGFSYYDLWGESENREKIVNGVSVRKACQFIGTEVARTLDPNVWVNCISDVCARLMIGMPSNSGLRYEYLPDRGLFVKEGWARPPAGIVISDIRYKNEIEAIRSWSGMLIRIKRNQTIEGDASQHKSETEMTEIPDSEFDYVIENDKTVDDLGQTIVKIVTGYVNDAQT